MASFADYVKDLMGVLPQVNGNPMLSATSMTDDNARYREDPFYRSREIQARDQLVLDEAERARLAAQSGSGMMGGGGDSGGGAPALSKDQESFFSWMDSTPEGQAFKDQRGQQIGNLIGLVSPFGGVRAAMNGLPTFNTDTLFGIPQEARNWQEQQRMQTPAYRNDAIARIQAEAEAYAQQQAINSGDFVRSGDGIVYANPQDVGPFMPSGGSGGGTGSYNESGSYGTSVDGLGDGGYQGVY
jgi:hypothetical protein